MVMDDLDTGTAADPGMDLAVVRGMDLVGAPGMGGRGGKLKIIELPVLQGVSSIQIRNLFNYNKKTEISYCEANSKSLK
ncbi:hypothetical protein DYI25_06800 [Mesobacillus boroniphilus]|uniref:Uncharacterized protein n=1 Tax=Mesobacillus boroniphilus TaxID=308892 RepID=A0A944GX79_9BACI|nr:hypothetical protein [Mesobacillus boroniphilus]